MSSIDPSNEEVPEQEVGFPVAGWLPRAHPPRATLSGRYCRLEPTLPERDAALLFRAYGSEPSDWTYLPYGPFSSESEYRAWMESTCRGEDPLFFTVFDLVTGDAVGLSSYLRVQREMGVLEIGHIHTARSFRRTRIATEALFLMIDHAFSQLGYRRCEWKCDSLNQPSRRAALRLGFLFEGIFRQDKVYKGRNRDTAWYSLLDREWPAFRSVFQRWLAPENFDAAGRQRSQLSVATELCRAEQSASELLLDSLS